MYQALFWFFLFTVVLMFASFGIAYFSFSRNRLPWLRPYLVYLACYAVWLLFTASYFYQAAYLPRPLPLLWSAAVVIRGMAAILMLYAAPLLVLRAVGVRVGRREWWLLTLPVAFVFGAVLVYYATGSTRVVMVPNELFNLYLGCLFLFAALRSNTSITDPLLAAFRPFFWFSAAAYLVFLSANILVVTVPRVALLPYLNVGLAAIYCLVWSILASMILLSRTERPHGGQDTDYDRLGQL